MMDFILSHCTHTHSDGKTFFDYQVFKRSGFIGDETPENFRCKSLEDTEKKMEHCLFPNQDPLCWNTGWFL
jgi:hypothetical protein